MKSGQERDLDFVLAHLDDLCMVPILMNGELIMASGTDKKLGAQSACHSVPAWR
jgi:hypothetical protein